MTATPAAVLNARKIDAGPARSYVAVCMHWRLPRFRAARAPKNATPAMSVVLSDDIPSRSAAIEHFRMNWFRQKNNSTQVRPFSGHRIR